MYEEYFERIKEECYIRNLRESTAKTYFHSLAVLMKWFNEEQKAEKLPEDVELTDIRRFLLMLRKDGKSIVYCNTVNSSLRFIYVRVLHRQWDEDIVPRMKRDYKLPDFLTLEEVELLIDTATEVRNKAIIALLYSTGMRLGELCNLRFSDVYMSRMQVYIRDSKNHGDRWTILSERALGLLKDYWYSYPEPREFIFVSLRAPHIPIQKSGVESMLAKIGKEAGIRIDVHPHLLRHSFGTHMIENKVPVQYVQSMMGHKSMNSTYHYLHTSNANLLGIKSPLDHPEKKKKGRKKKNG